MQTNSPGQARTSALLHPVKRSSILHVLIFFLSSRDNSAAWRSSSRRASSRDAAWRSFPSAAPVVNEKIGRAAGRERVCRYVYISGVRVSLKKKRSLKEQHKQHG